METRISSRTLRGDGRESLKSLGRPTRHMSRAAMLPTTVAPPFGRS